jgi:hypothetical protein
MVFLVGEVLQQWKNNTNPKVKKRANQHLEGLEQLGNKT